MLTASSTETFTTASKAWLRTVIAHPSLTDAAKTFGTALYLKFNFNHYKDTNELKAWPGWKTLMAEFGLKKRTISDNVTQLEYYQLLDVRRGRYDRAAKKRAGNEYFARFPVDKAMDYVSYQGANTAPCPPFNPLISLLGANPARSTEYTVIGDYRERSSSRSDLNVDESEAVRSTEAAPPEVARSGSGRPGGPSARSEVQPRKLTGELEASLNRLAAANGGGQ